MSLITTYLLSFLAYFALVLVFYIIPKSIIDYWRRETPAQWCARKTVWKDWRKQHMKEFDEMIAEQGFASRLDYWKSKL